MKKIKKIQTTAIMIIVICSMFCINVFASEGILTPDEEGCGHNRYRVTANVYETCTEDGYTEKTCTVCGDVQITTHPATGHMYEEIETNTEENYILKKCEYCGNEIKTTISTTEITKIEISDEINEIFQLIVLIIPISISFLAIRKGISFLRYSLESC